MIQRNDVYAFLITLFSAAALLAEPSKRGATNATGTAVSDAAAKKAEAERKVDEAYQAIVAKLPPEQQAWERTLQANLGGFYLPLYKAGRVKGTEQAWDYVKDVPGLPRVLLIGDSVSRGYTLPARKALAGKANVHRAPENCGSTANGLKKMEAWLGTGTWDVIHFNFGLHDSSTPVADYEKRLRLLVERLKKTGAKLVWASTTPRPPDGKEGPAFVAAVVERNEVAARVMKENNIAMDDLFTFITPHLAKVQNPKDVHFNAEGYEMLGKQVAETLEGLLK